MIVIDTHAWLWWVADRRQLSAAARKAMDAAGEEGQMHISCISAWEIAMLVARGRLELSMPAADWIASAESLPHVRFVAVDNRIALRSTQLARGAPADAADRIILATALVLGAPLVTKDRRMKRSGAVRTIW